MSKNLYTAHDKDSGQILFSNRVWDDPDRRYGKVLAEREIPFINHKGRIARLGRQFVDKGALKDMPLMNIRISRTKIGIGEANGATLTGLPVGATLAIEASGVTFFRERIDGRNVEISAPVPGAYTLSITKFPFREWRQEIVAE